MLASSVIERSPVLTVTQPSHAATAGLPSPPTAEDFSRWFTAHHAQLIAVAARIVGPELAEEVAQDAWANAWRSRRSFRRESAPSTWLFRIATNAAYTRCRKCRRSIRADDPIESASEIPSTDVSPLDVTLKADGRQQLAVAIDRLPAAQAVAVILVDLEDVSQRQAADGLGIPLNTLKTRLNRGRRRVTAALRTPTN